MDVLGIINIKFPDAKNIFDYQVAVDENNNQYISVWNLDSPQPTEKQLQQWEDELDLTLRQKMAVNKRVYPSLAAQLDMLYHDKLNNTTVWQDTITAVKASYPKPME